MLNRDPGVFIALKLAASCRLCGRPLPVGESVFLDDFGYRCISDCSGDHT